MIDDLASRIANHKWDYRLGELGELTKEEREEFYRSRVWNSTPDAYANCIPRVQFIQTYHSLDQYAKILDIGCGDGFATRWLADESCVEYVLGVDLCEKAISEAWEYAKKREHPEKLSYYVMSWEELGSAHDGRYDCVCAFEIFEHIPADEGRLMLKRMHAMLAPGGRGMVSTPEKHGMFGLANDQEREHISLVTRAELVALITEVTGVVPAHEMSEGDIILASWVKE